jgi:hypothetical protein
MSRGGKRQTSFDSERAREAARKSAEVRRRKREQQQETPELTDRERALAALRRALDGGNMAAMVAASKALLDLPQADPADWSSHAAVQRARNELTRKVQEIAERRREQAPGLVEEIRRAVGEGAEPSQVRGTSLDAMLVVLAETAAVSPSRLRALADLGERAQASRLEKAQRLGKLPS